MRRNVTKNLIFRGKIKYCPKTSLFKIKHKKKATSSDAALKGI